MHELLRDLPAGAMVLDLGCGQGSFETQCPFRIVRTDLERPARVPANFVQTDAAKLPFAERCFDLIISNNSLEHFEDLAAALDEIGRVIKMDGSLFVAVPDSTTVTDRLYRWLARGGGHVNPFSSAEDLAGAITRATGLRLVATRTLCTSLSFLNRCNRRARAPRKLLLLGGGTQVSLLLITYGMRLVDRLLGSRTSVYGWAFYFGNVEVAVDRTTWTNVCIQCGAAHPASSLVRGGG